MRWDELVRVCDGEFEGLEENILTPWVGDTNAFPTSNISFDEVVLHSLPRSLSIVLPATGL